MAFTLDIDTEGRSAETVAALLRGVAERLEGGELAGDIAAGDESVGEFSYEEDVVGVAGSDLEDPEQPA